MYIVFSNNHTWHVLSISVSGDLNITVVLLAFFFLQKLRLRFNNYIPMLLGTGVKIASTTQPVLFDTGCE